MKKLAILSMIFCLSFLSFTSTQATAYSPEKIVRIIQIEGVENVKNALAAAQVYESDQLELAILYFKLAKEKRENKNQDWLNDLKKAYTILSILKDAPQLEEELKPYLESYHAAAMAWLGATTYKTSLVANAWQVFDQLQKEYGNQVAIVGLLQAKTAAELPYFHNRKRFAKQIINNMIEQEEVYKNPLLMSQVYRYWVKLNPKADKKAYLKKAKALERAAV